MQANQDKAIDTSLEAITSRVTDLKTSLTAFLTKLDHEHQTLSWPSVLDSFALLSGQINMLNKVLRNDKTPSLKTLVLLPLNLKQDRDEELEKMTEARVMAFNHEVVPNYLRTKSEPDTEERELLLVKEASHLTPEAAQKQINALNKLSNNLLDIVNSARDEWEADNTGGRLSFTSFTPTDTSVLVSSMLNGNRLRQMQSPRPSYMGGNAMGPTGPGGMPTQPPRPQDQHGPGGMPTQPPRPQDQHGPMGKVQSSIKTNIKSGSAMHPYQHRPGMQ